MNLLDNDIAIALVSAISVIAAAVIASVSDRLSWRALVERDIKLFEDSYPFASNIEDEATLELLRMDIFRRMRKGVLPRSHTFAFNAFVVVFGTIVGSLVSCFVLEQSFLDSVPVTFASSLVTVLVMFAISRILKRYPATEKNPWYASAQHEKENAQAIQSAKEILEESRISEGWYSNYFQWQKAFKHALKNQAVENIETHIDGSKNNK